MKRWYVVKTETPITAEMLKKDSEKYGGVGLHMMLCVKHNVVSIPLCDRPNSNTGWRVSINVTPSVAERIINEGGVDIDDGGKYWSSINSVKTLFAGTEEEIPKIKGLF